jgi:predicted lipid carrier protein YhbT
MTDSTAAFLEKLAGRHEPLLDGVKGTLRLELLHDSRTERWLVDIDHGEVSVSRKNARADCVVRADKALFDAMARGEVNAMAAMLRGALAIEGDPHLLVLFQRLLPGPPRSGDRQVGVAEVVRS